MSLDIQVTYMFELNVAVCKSHTHAENGMFIIQSSSYSNYIESGKTQWHNFKLLKRDLSMLTKILKFILGIEQFV